MTEGQLVHLGMVNSYNVLVGNATLEEIISAKIGVFSHSLEESDAKKSIELMIFYFKEIEMYEYCAGLQDYIEDVFDNEGLYKKNYCGCTYPQIEKYVNRIKCKKCGMKIEL